MQIANNWVQFTGKFNTPDPLDRSKSIIIAGEFDHLKYEERPNEDGTYDALYKVAPIRMSIESGGKKLNGKLKSKNSKRLRAALYNYCITNNIDDFDTFYDSFTDVVISNLNEVINIFV